MSRNGSGIYSLPAGSAAVDGAIIDPVVFNTLISDLESDANTARPIVAGGTGATTAAAARTNLGAPPAPQSAAGAGQDVHFSSLTGNAFFAPAGGIWRVYWIGIQPAAGAGVQSHGIYIGAGGGLIAAATAGINYVGFAWRQS